MGTDRGRWLGAGLLMAIGALLEAVAVSLYWQPCAGNMLNGTIFTGRVVQAGFSEQCMVAMDQAPMFQLPSAGAGWTLVGSLGAVAALLLASAWLVVVGVLRVPLATRLVAAIPGVLAIAAVVNAAVGSLGAAHAADPVSLPLSVALELSVPVALGALAMAGVRGRLLMRAAIVVLAATATGFVHQVVEYFGTWVLSDANWDSPPGTGYLTVVLAGLTAVVTVALAGRRRGIAAAGGASPDAAAAGLPA
jgi:hypothetical protein